MVSIQVDEQTAKALEAAAAEAGVPLHVYVRSLVPQAVDRSKVSWDELEREISELSLDASLVSTYPRSELYSDHD
jgi:hypothetical protein